MRVFWVFGVAVAAAGDDGVFGDIGVWEFELGLLFRGGVGGRVVGAEGVVQVLLVGLGYLGGEGMKDGEQEVGYREGLLLGRLKDLREFDTVELGWTVELRLDTCWSKYVVRSIPVLVIFDSLYGKRSSVRVLLVPNL